MSDIAWNRRAPEFTPWEEDEGPPSKSLTSEEVEKMARELADQLYGDEEPRRLYVYGFSEYEYESLVETLDILTDTDTMEALAEAELDIAEGRVEEEK